MHPSHVTRFTDSSFCDYVCVNCGATDVAGDGWGDLAYPCSKPVGRGGLTLDEYNAACKAAAASAPK